MDSEFIEPELEYTTLTTVASGTSGTGNYWVGPGDPRIDDDN